MSRSLIYSGMLGGLSALVASVPCHATPTFFDVETDWLLAMQSVALEDFNTQTSGDAFHTSPLDVGPFSLSMIGGSTLSGRNQIDAPPLAISSFDVDATTVANVLIGTGDSLFLTFDAPVTGVGVQLASFNDDVLRTSIHVAGGEITPEIMGAGDVRFFGVTSDTSFTTVEFRFAGAGDGFGLDNVQFGDALSTAVVPTPTAAIGGLAMIGLLGVKRRRRAS